MQNRFRSATAVLTVCVVVAATAPQVAADDARQIFETAMERYEKRVASIESVTIVQEVMGMESTTRLTKVMIEDRPTLVASSAGHAGDLGSMYRNFDDMAKNATVTGTERVDGHLCWVVHVTELGGMHVGAEGAGDFESSDGTLYVDQNDFILRRMMMNGVAMRDGVKKPVSMEMHLKDYREVDGWLHPFLSEVSLGGAGGGEPTEMAEMRKAMAQMKEELAQMPAEQRQMMEQMMKGRIPEFEEATDGGKLTIKVTVREIRVNEPKE